LARTQKIESTKRFPSFLKLKRWESLPLRPFYNFKKQSAAATSHFPLTNLK